MKKTGLLALLISFIFIIGIACGAEVTGGFGPDQNTDTGLEGDALIEGLGLYPNATACSTDSECNSGHCASDFDGVGSWCADVNYCAHNGTVSYANGSKTCYGNYRETCTYGNWVAALCSSACSGGVCAGGTVCGDGLCEVGEDCDICAADCGACPTPAPTPTPEESPSPGGGPGGGPSRTPTPTPTPTPSPTPTPEEEYERETITTESSSYQPGGGQIGDNLVEAGITDEAEIEEILEHMENSTVNKTLKVDKKTHKETGEEVIESTVTISITNTGDDAFEAGKAYEFIPKDLVPDPSVIHSNVPFEIQETDDYWILVWSYDSLAPGETAAFTYTVNFALDDSILKNSNSLFSAEKREIPPEQLYGAITVKALFNGVAQEGIVVSLFKDGVKVAEGTTDATGTVEFALLKPGSYHASSAETDALFGKESETIQVSAGITKIVELHLESKVAPTPAPPVEVDYTWLWGLIIILVIAGLLYYFREPILAIFAGAGKKEGLAGAVKKAERMEKGEPKRSFKKFKHEDAGAAAAKEAKPGRGKAYKCRECGEEFHTRIALKAHKRHH